MIHSFKISPLNCASGYGNTGRFLPVSQGFSERAFWGDNSPGWRSGRRISDCLWPRDKRSDCTMTRKQSKEQVRSTMKVPETQVGSTRKFESCPRYFYQSFTLNKFTMSNQSHSITADTAVTDAVVGTGALHGRQIVLTVPVTVSLTIELTNDGLCVTDAAGKAA